MLYLQSVFNRAVAGLAVCASMALMAAPGAFANNLFGWDAGSAAWVGNLPALLSFLETGSINDRSLFASIRDSGWTADEVRLGMRKVYNVDVARVARFLNSRRGINFLSLQTSAYYPRNGTRISAIPALRSAIIKASIGGNLSSVGIISNLPVDFLLARQGSLDGGGLVICAPEKVDKRQASSLLNWYLFLPACIARDAALY